jgi:hypothetical protein
MRIIDQTPFFKENGEISIVDRGKAIMQYGFGWFKDIEAQKTIIAVFEKVLDKNYSLLRNVTPPGLEARIPFILVGPTGVFVMSVTPLTGMFRAKGDQWGTVTGSTYKPIKPNLLTRTERMARAIQVYLQRQGYTEITSVEAVLLCSDPSITVDSLRPIIRVVLRDALERFAVSIAQARIILSPETAYNIVKRILNPAPPPSPQQPVETPPAEAEAAVPAADSVEDPYVPSFALPPAESTVAETLTPPIQFAQGETFPVAAPPARARKKISRGQWIFLIALFVFWLLIMAAFAFVVAKDLIF